MVTVLALVSVPVAKARSRGVFRGPAHSVGMLGCKWSPILCAMALAHAKAVEPQSRTCHPNRRDSGQQLRLSGRLAACRGCSGLLARICRQNGDSWWLRRRFGQHTVELGWLCWQHVRYMQGCLAAFRPLRACFRSGRPWALAAALVAVAGSRGGRGIWLCSAVRPIVLGFWGANGRRFCAPRRWRILRSARPQ